jgi:chitin disaccharide deacetylase
MKKLVVNADDFGRSSPINHGIIEGHQKGIITSASLMTNREGFDEAVQLARDNPRLGIGLHLDLDAFFEVQHGVGRLLRYRDPSVPMAAIIKETEAQIEKIMATGLPVKHLDGHHHVHLRPELFGSIAALTAKYKIPVIRYFRGFYEGLYPGVKMDWVPELVRRFDLRCTDTFFAGWEAVESSLPGYSYLDLSLDFDTAELMVHPGKGETWRERELQHCTSAEIRQRLKEKNIQLCTFSELSAVAHG